MTVQVRPQPEKNSVASGIEQGSYAMSLAKAVARKHRISLEELFSPRRFRNLVVPRQEAYCVVFQYFGCVTETALFFGRDRTTVQYGIHRHQIRTVGVKSA